MMKRYLAAAALALCLSGCGGGDGDGAALPGSVVAAQGQATRSALTAARASAAPAAATASQVTKLMEFAEAQYSLYFPSKQTTRFAGSLAYRFYPESGAYLVVDGDQVFVAGPPFGNQVVYVGLVGDFVPQTFPLRDAYQAYVSAGSTTNFTVSGTCSGSATQTMSPTSPTTFEGAPAFVATQTMSVALSNCTPATTAVSVLGYYDSNYTPSGVVVPGVEYASFLSKPQSLPDAVKVGDTAVFATLTVYSSSAKTTITGQRVLSYVIETDTATTAIVRLIIRSYSATNALQFTQQSMYRIGEDGSLTILSIDIQYSGGSTTHLIYTPKN